MYDYYFFDEPHRKFDDRCEYGLCEKSIVYRRMRAAIKEWKPPYNHTTASNIEEVETANSVGGCTNGFTDVLEYMLYNVSGETGLPAHYTCCMYLYRKTGAQEHGGEKEEDTYLETGHVCNAIPIMIGSRLEKKVMSRLASMLGIGVSSVYDEHYLHTVYSGSFMINGTFYYSLFRESNNNKICHNSKSKYRGEETVAYFYDNTCNRGVKLFTNKSGELRVNDRDGNEVTDVTSEVMSQLYKECLHNPRHYTRNMDLIKGFFSCIKRQGLAGIDNFKNKIYTNYSIGLNTFMDKLPTSAMTNPMWNGSLLVGKINLGISQRLIYPKSKSETKKQNEQKLKMCTGGKSNHVRYLVETQRRRMRKTRMSANDANSSNCWQKQRAAARQDDDGVPPATKRRCVRKDYRSAQQKDSTGTPTHTILGSKDVKAGGLIERLEQGERNGPSAFNQVSVSYLPLIRVLSNTVQKLQVEHVHAESSKTVPRDAYGFICMKYMGNIATAGKNMLFTDRAHVSYGHVHKVIDAVERGIDTLISEWAQVPQSTSDTVGLAVQPHDTDGDWLHVVINNAVTEWSVSQRRLLQFIVFLKTRCHRFVWTKTVGNYLCIYYYEGVPLLRYERGEAMFELLRAALTVGANGGDVLKEDVACLYFSRDELEMLAATATANIPDCRSRTLVDRTNTLIDEWFMRSHHNADGCGYESLSPSSLLAKHVDQFTDYTAPAKRSVSVNARKSACVNVYYQKAAELIRGFHIFVDPRGFERATAKQVADEHGLPEWVTLRDFARAHAETSNCPPSQTTGTDGGGGGTDRSLDNFYLLRTIFADMDGHNVEDANVLDASVDLNLAFSYSFSLTFVDRTKKGLDIIVPPPRNAASVCSWDATGEPNMVLFMVCTVRKRDGEDSNTIDIGEMLCASSDARRSNADFRDGGGGGDKGSRRRSTTTPSDDHVNFPPFRKLSVVQSGDGNYHVCFMRNDAVLLRSIQKLRRTVGLDVVPPAPPDMSNATRLAENAYAYRCKPEVNVYDALTYLQTRCTTFKGSQNERVVTVDVRVHGRSDKYDGIKVVNSFGQKGLALIKDLRPFFRQQTPASHNVPVQLVMNNCSFVSRQPIGQCLQMQRNMYAVTESVAGERVGVGYTVVFFTENEPDTKTCLVRFDEMLRSVVITSLLPVTQILKSCLDNVFNPFGVLYPPQTSHIMSLYKCKGVSYKFSGIKSTSFSTKEDIQALIYLYNVYTQTPTQSRLGGSKALLDVMEAMHEKGDRQRLRDIGALRKKRGRPDPVDPSIPNQTYDLRLEGQWIDGFDSFLAHNRGETMGCAQASDNVLRTYNSRDNVYRTTHICGDPNLITDALDNRSSSIDHLVARFTGKERDHHHNHRRRHHDST